MQPKDLEAISHIRTLIKTGRFRALRRAAGLSQREIGAACGVSPVAVTNWEAKRRMPQTQTALLLADVVRRIEKQQRMSV